MRLRKPNTNPPVLAAGLPLTAELSRSFRVELITPLYGGGVVAGEPDRAMPIRAAALRGQLRFWWRLLNRQADTDSRQLFNKEIAVWGGITPKGAVASRVVVEVAEVTNIVAKPCTHYPQKANGEWITTPEFPYGPGYALFPGQGKADRDHGVTEPPHDILLPGLRFTLRIRVLPLRDKDGQVLHEPGASVTDIWSKVFPALRWWASFGGLGARTRRGLGSVKVKEISDSSSRELFSPVTREEAAAQGCLLCRRNDRPDAQRAWEDAVERLRQFRQGVGVGRNPGSDPTKPKKLGRSRWPEADSIRKITGCHLDLPARPAQAAKNHAPGHPARLSFPRAVFGLPIITQFIDGPRPNARPTAAERLKLDPDQTQLLPVVAGKLKDRLASPLILKAMWDGTHYVPIALLLPHTHVDGMEAQRAGKKGGTLPHAHVDGMALQLKNVEKHDNPNLSEGKDFAAGDWWPADARQTMTQGRPAPNPLQNQSGKVLADFLAFFAQEG